MSLEQLSPSAHCTFTWRFLNAVDQESFGIADMNRLKVMSFSELLEHLENRDYKTSQDTLRTHEEIIILKDFFDHTVESSLSAEAAAKIQAFLSRVILPGPEFAEKSPFDIEKSPALAPDEVVQFHQMSSDGLALLSKLSSFQSLIEQERNSVDTSLIVGAASFADADDPWTCETSHTTATEVLNSFLDSRDAKTLSTTLTNILQQYIKPAFSKIARNPAITPEGRKAIYDPSPPDPRAAAAAGESEKTSTPWKYHDVYIVTVLKWIVQALPLADPPTTHETSPNLIPPILTLIDDPSTTFKAKGLSLLSHLLPLLPPKFLERTGLSDVLEQSLIPCLAYLPPLTETRESLMVLGEAYPAVIALARACDLTDKGKGRGMLKGPLDRLMREGILAGYAQAGEQVKIAEFLAKQMGVLVGEMGMEWVRYLKHLLPILSANLSRPFAVTYPPLLLSTLETLQTIILVAWPRVPYYRFEILKGLTVCWCRIADELSDGQDASEELKDVQRSIERTVKMLTATLVHEKIDTSGEYKRIVAEGDKRLRGLLTA